MLKKFLPFFLMLLGLFHPAQAAFFKPSLQVYTLKTEHFYIHFPKNIGGVADDVAQTAEKVYTKLSVKLKWKPKGRTHLVLNDQTDIANGLATVLPANYILLNVTPPDAGSSLDNYSNYLDLLITHEFTHILHIDQHHRMADPLHWLFGKIVAPNGLTPGWMREGLAAWEESIETGRGRANASYSDMLLRTSILEDRFPTIDKATGSPISWPGGDTQYIFGVKFWQWIVDKNGEESLTRYMEEYSSGLWLFSLNNKARRVFNKSFYQLWKEWKEELRIKYATLKSDLESQGLTPLEDFKRNDREMFRYLTPHPSGIGQAYMKLSQDEESRLVLDFQPGGKPTALKRGISGQMSFSRDGEGKLLAYSAGAQVEKYTLFSEVYVYDIKSQGSSRVYEKGNEKKSMRASDPDFAPFDGGQRWLVMVRTDAGTDNLYVYDRTNKRGYYLTHSSEYTQFSNPRYSPDGSRIVVSRHDNNGNRDIVLYDKTGNEITKVTNDPALDNNPVWSPDGRSVYFESDKSGISNIYRYDVGSMTTTKITNVLTGVFDPQITADGSRMAVTAYNSHGYYLAWVHLDSYISTPTYNSSSLTNQPSYTVALKGVPSEELEEGAPVTEELSEELDSEEYEEVPGGDQYANFKTISLFKNSAADTNYQATQAPLNETKPINPSAGYEIPEQPTTTSSTPAPITQTASNEESGYESQLSGKTPPENIQEIPSGAKKYHAFPQVLVPRYIVPTFATLDSAFVLGMATGRFDPLYRHNWSLSTNYRSDANFLGSAASYAYTRYFPTFYVGANRYALNWGDIFATGEDFFEQRMQGYAGVSMAIPNHAFNVSYFYEDRKELTDIPAGFTLANLDKYAGFHSQYIYTRYKQFPRSISQEDGTMFKLGFDITDSMFGSAEVNEQKILTGDFRYYFEMPWADHHVFAIRAAGGFAWGDPQFSGTFRLGGPFGEGNLAGYSDRLFPLRGLPGITFAGDRALLFSGEYRLPLVTVERGIGTWPISLNRLHLAFFGDYGDSWFRNGKDNVGFFDDFLLGAGAELKGDFVLGYGLPVTARLGYAVILLNRDQIAGLTDSMTGAALDQGTVYFQFGTSF